MRENTTTPAPSRPLPPTSATKTPQRTSLAPKSTRAAQDGAPAGTQRLHAGAPIGKPQPPTGRAKTALFSPHCITTHCHALTLIRLYQTIICTSRTNQSALTSPSADMADYKTTACANADMHPCTNRCMYAHAHAFNATVACRHTCFITVGKGDAQNAADKGPATPSSAPQNTVVKV